MSLNGWEQDRIERIEMRIAALEDAVFKTRLGPSPEIEAEEINERKKAVAEILEASVEKTKHMLRPEGTEFYNPGHSCGELAQTSHVTVPPVDRTAQELITGEPVPADRSHTEIKSDGMQKSYVVLSPEERAKGFVRPVRSSYIHVGVGGSEVDPNDMARRGRKPPGCGTLTTMGPKLAETYARDPKFYTGTFCAGCRKHFPLDQFVWADTNELVGS